MRWSRLFIPTLREEPAEGDPRWRLLVRAGYARPGGAFLFLGQRALNKIASNVCGQLEALGAQEVSLGVSLREAAQFASGDLRSYKQLPQMFVQRRGAVVEAAAFGLDAGAVRDAFARGLEACGVAVSVADPEGDAVPEAFHTPGVKSIAELAAFAGAPETSLIKSVVMSGPQGLVLALVRGDHSLSERNLQAVVGRNLHAATAEEIRVVFGAGPGSLGPVGLAGVRILADFALRGRRNMICGANRDDYHLRNVTPGKDFAAEFCDLRVEDGIGADGVPVLSGDVVLGSVEESVAGLTVLNESGSTYAPGFVFGELALDRVLAQVGRDESGLVMPPRIAPFSVAFVVVNAKDAEQAATGHRLYEAALVAGCDAVLDDRDERPGVKFKDCELVGIPWRVTVGKKLAEGVVGGSGRHSKESWDVPVGEAVEFVRGRWDVVA